MINTLSHEYLALEGYDDLPGHYWEPPKLVLTINLTSIFIFNDYNVNKQKLIYKRMMKLESNI